MIWKEHYFVDGSDFHSCGGREGELACVWTSNLAAWSVCRTHCEHALFILLSGYLLTCYRNVKSHVASPSHATVRQPDSQA